MFGLLLRSELLQGSAVRTWNCVLNIANFFRYKLTNYRQVVMPRTRRRHHSRSRSRSRSHSHERDREVKRRRVESPDRRSVSMESDPGTTKTSNPDEIPIIDVTTSPESREASPKNVKDDPTPKKLSNSDDTPKKLSNSDDTPKKLSNSDDTPKKLSNSDDTPKKILNATLESEMTPKKVLSPAQNKKVEEKMKQRQEREEQKLKERNEKLEQKKKEKEEKDEQRRKEREEKEELRRKEKDEKEEQKRKEREEKEEQKRKEREEKEEQRRKEKEEKDEQKRKEREERELKKQQEIDEKTRDKKKKEELIQKEKAAFVSFFRKSSSGVSEPKKGEEEKTYAFMPFAVKSDMRLAPIIRSSITFEEKEKLVEMIKIQRKTVLYLAELKKGKKIGRCAETWPVADEDDDWNLILIEETESDIGERVEEQKKVDKMRAKLLKFHENRRPAYFGTWRKTSKCITPRKPYVMDKTLFDYDIESDDDWEEEEPGESLAGSDDEEKENEADDYEVDNDFFVPHGYLSDEEIEAESQQEVSAEKQKEKLKILQLEFDEEMKSKTERIKPRLIGCIWDNKLIPKIQDAIHKFLGDRMMIVTGPISIPKRDLLQKTPVKPITPNRKQLGEELIPEFLNLIHGSTNNKNSLVVEFLNYLSTLDITIAKTCLLSQLKKLAKWRKCPDEGTMHNKLCWYVDENVRTIYNVKLNLPNSWSYTGGKQDENTTSNKKLSV